MTAFPRSFRCRSRWGVHDRGGTPVATPRADTSRLESPQGMVGLAAPQSETEVTQELNGFLPFSRKLLTKLDKRATLRVCRGILTPESLT